MALQPGDRISSWEVMRPIGAGGMGSVYLCRDSLGDHLWAAVKVNDIKGEEGRRRFMREVEALAAVQHPGIVGLLGWGEDHEQGVLWFAMEFLDGDNLEDRMGQGPLSVDEVRPLFTLLARALQHAAAHGISHRDVKPANIVLTPGGARLVDFGIAIQEDRTRLTVYDHVPGTPLYMAPEVFAGDDPDPRLGDVYALGLILHEALTGAPALLLPDTLSDQQRFARVVTSKLTTEAFDPGPDFPPGVRELVRRCTEPEPEDRLADWDVFVDLLEGRGLAPVPATAVERPGSPWVRSLAVAGVLAAVLAGVLALTVGVGAWWWLRSQPAPEPIVLTEPLVEEPAEVAEPAVHPEEPGEPPVEEPAGVVSRPVVVEPRPREADQPPEEPAEPEGVADSTPGPGEIQVTVTGGGAAVVKVTDIVLARRDGRDTQLETLSGAIRCEQTITDLDGAISDVNLMRVHRDYLVNARYVTALEADEAGTWATTRAGRVPVGVRQADSLRAAAGL